MLQGSKTKLEIIKLSWMTGYQFKKLQLPKLCDFYCTETHSNVFTSFIILPYLYYILIR